MPVAGIMRLTNIMVVPPSLPFKTVAEFIAYAKAKPGKLSFASSGNGTSVHMSGELFKAMTGIDMVHVPYRGSARANAGSHDRQGACDVRQSAGVDRIRAQRPVARARRHGGSALAEALPDVPTIAETVPGYEASVWYGISAPKGTPPDIVAILNKSVGSALADPKMKAKLAELGGIPMPMTPAEFGKLIADETEKWAKVVKFANISVD